MLDSGIINLNKPAGIRSVGAMKKVQEILKVPKIGYTGTLDPQVTGVLPILIGKAVKLSEILSKSDKTYVGEIHFHKDISKKEIPIFPEISERIENDELLDIMRGQITDLKPKYRKVLILRYYMQRSIGEIAQILGIPKEKVSERIYYATDLLKKKCQKFFP